MPCVNNVLGCVRDYARRQRGKDWGLKSSIIQSDFLSLTLAPFGTTLYITSYIYTLLSLSFIAAAALSLSLSYPSTYIWRITYANSNINNQIYLELLEAS